MTDILVIGTGGLAREFTSAFADAVRIVGYASTNHDEHGQFGLPGTLFKGEVTPGLVGTASVVIAIGDPAVRRAIHHRLKPLGFVFPSLVHASSVVSERARLEEGVIVSPQCVVSPNVTLGALSYLNFCCGVGHDATVGRCVQINPGSQLGGFSEIGEGTLIGSGSTILQGVKVGARATVASGSVVFSEVPDDATVMGNPARRMRAFEK
ncbi:acetyltransferase [Cupriavidus respiraculi]|uniref:acetyltransferase n=1 Tax=Cupriavidus respiraculi TaxID=195930 RepID=UPI001C971C46|nr:acetyltransferase [Cupriavidus respiraculi]MBY4947386.1 acetyltransferase [Cupriavidus respiraculi]